MKELTIEEKAKAYDEAKLRMSAAYNSNRCTIGFMNEIFPELKESEGERIRKGLIKQFKALNTLEIWGGLKREDIITYLEKQGEQNSDDKIQLDKKYKCIASPRYSTFITGKIYKPEDKFLCRLMNFCYDCFEPIEDNEQEVEPKFHEGEWTMTDKNNVVQIKAIEDSKYVLENTMRFSVDYVDKCWRKWDISDAKDGDVLTWDNGRYIVLFEKLQDNIIAHCSYNTHSKHLGFYTVYDTQFDSNLRFVPATKEQRDILFQKMKEAGYEWDAEKKELKKIEQKSAEWSEEDEINLYYVRYNLANKSDTLDKWLKSLKDRVQLQPKQEWSEKDEHLFQIIIDILDKEEHKGNLSHTDLIACVRKLKSLSPQNSITDEELAQAKKDAYNDTLDKIEYHSGEPTFDDGWDSAIWYLKKRNIQPQNIWKPDSSMLICLEYAIKHINKDGDKRILSKLLEQLKQL